MEKIHFLNLNDFSQVENSLSEEEKRKAKVKIHNLKKENINSIDLNTCFYCGNSFKDKKKENGICNSHTIPKSFLDRISEKGRLYNFNTIFDSDFSNKNNGLNNAGVFKLICRKCDREIFKSYENVNNYNSKPTVEMLAQIDMKNNLKNIDKCNKNVEFFKMLEEKSLYNENMENVEEIINKYFSFLETSSRKKRFENDLLEYKKGYNYAKKVSQQPFNDYNILYFKKLNYVVPIAYQGTIALITDLRGSIINDVYNDNKKYEVKNISLCIFPLENSSVIIFFTNKKNKRYSEFFNDFRKLNLEKQLSIVNYILFSYTEEYFLSPLVPKNVLNKLRELACKMSDCYRRTENPSDRKKVFKQIQEIYNYNKSSEFPNLLSEKYSIENLKKENI